MTPNSMSPISEPTPIPSPASILGSINPRFLIVTLEYRVTSADVPEVVGIAIKGKDLSVNFLNYSICDQF